MTVSLGELAAKKEVKCGGRRNLQALVRKIQHVLVIKHCMDGLKSSARKSRKAVADM
jgi:hypothetical protein